MHKFNNYTLPRGCAVPTTALVETWYSSILYLLSQILIFTALGETHYSWVDSKIDQDSQKLDGLGEKQEKPGKEKLEERSNNKSR